MYFKPTVMRILLGMLLVASLALAEYFVAGEEIREAQRAALTGATMAQQRRSLQHSQSLIAILASVGDLGLRSTVSQQLTDTLGQLRSIHQALIPSAPNDYATSATIDSLNAIYFGAPHSLDRRMQEYFSIVEQLLRPTESNSSAGDTESPSSAAQYAPLLAAVDAAIQQSDVASKDHIAKIRLRDASALGFLMFLLGAGGLYASHRREREAVGHISSQARQLSAARFETLADASPIGIFLNDPTGACTYTNLRWQEITGINFADSLGDGWQEMIHPDDRAKVFAEWNATVAAGGEFSYEFRIRTASDETRWVHSRAATADNVDDQTLAYIGTTEDITERLEIGAQLRRAEERLALAMRGTDDGLWDWDVERGDLYLSERYCALLGYTQSELEHSIETFSNLLHPDDKTATMDAIENHLKTREPYYVEMRMRTKSGDYRWFSAGGQAEWVDDGHPKRMAGSIRDISARRSLAHETRLTEASIASASEIAFRVAADGRVTHANPAACLSLGYTFEELTGRPIWDINVGLTAEKWSENWNREDTGTSIAFESEYRRCDGSTFPVEVTSNLIYVDGEKFAFGYVRDISERRTAERITLRYTEALMRSNEELEHFAYISSHDLQEPLRKIQAFSDRLKTSSGDALGEKGLDYLERIRSSAKRMQVLIEDLLTYSQVGNSSEMFGSCDLNNILADVLEDLEIRIRRENGEVTASELPAIEGDATQLRQLLQNLIGNALKFHADGCSPLVNVRTEFLDAAHDCAHLWKHIVISIEDNGIGFEEKYANKIFAPFQRLHGRGEYEGTGIGLAVCKKIVERHNGTISVVSQLGAGTTFRVVLPLTQPFDAAMIVESAIL